MQSRDIRLEVTDWSISRASLGRRHRACGEIDVVSDPGPSHRPTAVRATSPSSSCPTWPTCTTPPGRENFGIASTVSRCRLRVALCPRLHSPAGLQRTQLHCYRIQLPAVGKRRPVFVAYRCARVAPDGRVIAASGLKISCVPVVRSLPGGHPPSGRRCRPCRNRDHRL